MALPGSILHPADAAPARRNEGAALAAEGLIVRTGGRVLLGPVDLLIQPGERVGFLGPSGCGKSQLLDRLMGLTPLKRGDGRVEIRLGGSEAGPSGGEGQATHGPSVPGVARARFPIAAVFQTNALFDILTVRENVGVGAQAASGGDDPEIDDLIRDMGLDPARDGDKFPAELSGGMQRRVALARALRAHPAILVLDEPLVGLDGESRRIVRTRVERAHRDSGGAMAVLVVTHDYEFAASFCDRMFWIDPAGRRLIELEEWPGASPSDRERRIRDLLRGPDEGGATPSGARGGSATDTHKETTRARPRGALATALREQGRQVRETVRALEGSVGEIGGMLAGFLHGPASGIRPGRDFVELWLRACILAIPYVALLFALVGLLLVFQSERLLAPIGLASRIPEAVTIGVVQGLGPLLLVLIMAGRTGSAMAADLGGQRLSRQVEMWSLLGRDPRTVLFGPRAWALVAAFPLLLLLSEFIALGTGWLFYTIVPQTGLTARAFWGGVRDAWELGPTLGGMARVALDGGILAVIAYRFGVSPKRGAEDVAESSTRTVVVASLAFLVVEVLWTVV